MTCPNCGNETPADAVQCPRCGSRLEVAEPAASSPWGAPSSVPPAPPSSGPAWGATTPGQPPYGAPPSGPTPYGGQPSPGAQPGYGSAPPYGAPQYGAPPSGGQQYGSPPPFGGGTYQPFPQESGWGGQPAGRVLAGWWRRVGATVIDGIMIGIISGILGAVAGRAVEYIVGFLIGLAYTTFLLVARGQTVGMMAVGTKCVVESTGANLAAGPAIGRYVLAEVLGITVIGGLLDILWPLWDGKNQTLHDKAVGTLVIMAR